MSEQQESTLNRVVFLFIVLLWAVGSLFGPLKRALDLMAGKPADSPPDLTQPQKLAEPMRQQALPDNKTQALWLQEAVKKAGPDFDKIQMIGTAEGITITGRVESLDDRTRAETIARGIIPGMSIENELQVGE